MELADSQAAHFERTENVSHFTTGSSKNHIRPDKPTPEQQPRNSVTVEAHIPMKVGKPVVLRTGKNVVPVENSTTFRLYVSKTNVASTPPNQISDGTYEDPPDRKSERQTIQKKQTTATTVTTLQCSESTSTT